MPERPAHRAFDDLETSTGSEFRKYRLRSQHFDPLAKVRNGPFGRSGAFARWDVTALFLTAAVLMGIMALWSSLQPGLSAISAGMTRRAA